MPIRKPCIICGELTNGGTRCDTHETELQQRKAATRNTPERQAYKRQMYGPYYRQQRKHIIATATHCALCGQPFQHGDKIEADHIYPGDPLSPLQPAHRRCNQRKSDKPTFKQ